MERQWQKTAMHEGRTVTYGFQLYERGDIDFPPPFSKIVGLVLAPLGTQIILLCFVQLHVHHIFLHRDPSLLPRRCVSKQWEVNILEIDLRSDSLF